MVQAKLFFAGPSDILHVLSHTERARSIKYVLAGMSPEPGLFSFQSADEIEELGVAKAGDQAQEPTYLITYSHLDVLVREVPQRTGGVLFSIDQRKNPSTLGIRPGGVFGAQAVIAGQLGPGTGDPISDELFALIGDEIQQRFKKIKSFWVGDEALSLLEKGCRLTTNVKSSPEFDLQV